MKSRSDKALSDPPEEQISSVKFLPPTSGEENLLAVGSWDCSVRVYDFKRNVSVRYATEMPVLSVAPMSSTSICFGGLEKRIFVKDDVNVDDNTGEARAIGSHNQPICSVSFNKLHGVVVSGGFDSTIRLWSARQNERSTSVATINTEKKVICMDVRENLVAAGLSEGSLGIWDLRNISKHLKLRDVKDSLNLQCIGIFPDLKRIAYGTSEGRASIEAIDDRDSRGDFLFKPHVDKANNISHPVNCICFVEGSSKFLMGGSDGKLRMWDPDTRKLQADFPVYPNQIASVDVSSSGTHAVVGCSYVDDRELEDDVNVPPPTVFVRSISEYVHGSATLSSKSSSSNVQRKA